MDSPNLEVRAPTLPPGWGGQGIGLRLGIPTPIQDPKPWPGSSRGNIRHLAWHMLELGTRHFGTTWPQANLALNPSPCPQFLKFETTTETTAKRKLGPKGQIN